MATKIKHIRIDSIRSDDNENLALSGYHISYNVCDTANPRMSTGGSFILEDLVLTDTLAEWWNKVKQQVLNHEAAEVVKYNEMKAQKEQLQ